MSTTRELHGRRRTRAVHAPLVNAHAGAGAGVLLNVESRDIERKLRTRAFRAAGYQVIEAGTAGGALIAAGRHAPSIAVVDVSLCDTGLLELCETLERLRPGLVLVLVFSGEMVPQFGEGVAPAAHAYVPGSVQPDALVAVVGDTVAREARERDARPWVISDEAGLILDANPDAARLLNRTVRGLYEKSLLMFFEQDRESWRAALTRAASGETVRQSGKLRPKERRPVRVCVDVARSTDGDGTALRWTFAIEPHDGGTRPAR
jgi:CheY-like chemotaxis protein